MKRIALILLLFLYLVPAIGVTVSVHYCGGQLAGISLGEKPRGLCACGSKKMKRDCCKDEVISLKLNTDQQKLSPANLIPNVQYILQPAAPAIVLNVSFPVVDSNYILISEYPPGRLRQPLYLLHESFLI